MASPSLERREALTYCAIPVDVTMGTLAAIVPGAIDQLEQYLGSRGIEPAGPSLIRYRTVSEQAPFTVEVGWVTEPGIWIDAPFVADVLPAGRYATLRHDGPYAELHEATARLHAWADQIAEPYDVTAGPAGELWECWYELYLDDPHVGPQGPQGAVEIGVLTAS